MLTHPFIALCLVLIALFCLNVIATSYALGRMHAWLRERGEGFGRDRDRGF